MGHYYADDFVTIYHGDSREILPTLDLPAPDVLILDPPFDLWADVPRIEATTVFAFTNLPHRAYPCAMYGQPRAEVIWHYREGRWVSHKLPLVCHTTILVFGPTGQVYVGDEQDTTPRYVGRQTPTDLAAARGSRAGMVTPRSIYTPRARRALVSVIEAPARVASVGRFAKPEAVIRPLVEWAAGRTLLDPYCGAGTSLLVAKQLGMTAVGVDRDERSCELTARRLAQEALPFEIGSYSGAKPDDGDDAAEVDVARRAEHHHALVARVDVHAVDEDASPVDHQPVTSADLGGGDLADCHTHSLEPVHTPANTQLRESLEAGA
jgi:hypothetical protein